MTCHKPTSNGARGTAPREMVRLDSLDGWRAPDGAADLDGLDVVTTDGHKMGKVSGFIGSPSLREADFAVVDNGSWVAHHAWPVPIAMLTASDGVAHVPVTHYRFADAPNWKTSAPDYDVFHAYWYGQPLPESDDAGAGEEVAEGEFVEARMPGR